MSGGALDYAYYRIYDVVDIIRDEIAKIEGKIQSGDLEWFEPHPYYVKNHPDRPEFKSREALANAVLKKYREALDCMERASIYAQRIEWLLSADDGADNFILRTEEELEKLESGKKDCGE